MGRGRLKSGLQAFGEGRLRRVPSAFVEDILIDPGAGLTGDPGHPDSGSGGGGGDNSGNPTLGGPIIGGPGVNIDVSPGDPVIIITEPEVENPVGTTPVITTTEPNLGDGGPIRPPVRDPINNGGGALPAEGGSIPRRDTTNKNLSNPLSVQQTPSTTVGSEGRIRFPADGITNTDPTIITEPQFDPGVLGGSVNDYIKNNLSVYTLHINDFIGPGGASGANYVRGGRSFLRMLKSIYSLSPDGKDKDPLISTTTTGLSAAGFTVSARTIANLAEGVSGANAFSQQFFRFDLTKNNGATGMTSGDTLGHANLVLSIKNHMVDRSSAPAYTGDTTSFVQGPLSTPRMDCEIIKIAATYDADFGRYLNGVSWGATYAWDSFYGTSGTDVDTSLSVGFTIDQPLSHNQELNIDIKELAQDAITNTSGILRFAIRPIATQYGITGASMGGARMGLNMFSIDRNVKKPRLEIAFRPSSASSLSRLADLGRL